MTNKYVVWFSEVDKDDIAVVGGKGANLGEMTKAGFPVPGGFIVTSHAYFDFLEKTGIKNEITRILEEVDVNDSDSLEGASRKIKQIIKNEGIPEDIADDICQAYFKMDKGLMTHAVVAVRSSATAEDLPDASFAGQQETFLNVHGEANLLENIRACWASLFTPRAIFYRVTNKFDHMKVGIAVPVQKMIQSDVSGIMFTLDPVTNDKTKVVIEAIYGLGEFIVQGMVTPDQYEVDKESFSIIKITVKEQEKKMMKKGTKNVTVRLSLKDGGKQKCTDKQIIELAKVGAKLEKHYYFPQDIEWAIDQGEIYIVQTRPVTTSNKKETSKGSISQSEEVILKGDPASPGIASGVVKLLVSAKEIEKISTGDVLVTEQTNPDFVPAMKKASAIVTERGGRTSHAAIVSRELGIPCVVGAKNAKTILKDRMIITVNGATGEIYKGNLTHKIVAPRVAEEREIKTATKVYVNLGEPERVDAIAKKYVDGVGLLRAEFMIANIGVHPKKLIEDHKEHVFIDRLAEDLSKFCKAFNPRPVIYRATDFKTNEYRQLKGGAAFEPEEPNPMLGFRGVARYVADQKVFDMELEAIKKVRNKMGYKNLWLMLPFVRTPKELLEVKKLIAENDLTRSSNFKLFIMVEIPTNVIRIDDFIDVGIDGISIGSNDLTMLILGTDRDNSEVAHDFNEMDPAVLWAIERAVTAAKKRNIMASICGQAPSDNMEMVDKLVSWGVTSISVNPDAIYRVRETISLAEKKYLREHTKKRD